MTALWITLHLSIVTTTCTSWGPEAGSTGMSDEQDHVPGGEETLDVPPDTHVTQPKSSSAISSYFCQRAKVLLRSLN
jgi:hypothetical protein